MLARLNAWETRQLPATRSNQSSLPWLFPLRFLSARTIYWAVVRANLTSTETPMRVLRIHEVALLSLSRSRPSFSIRFAGQHNSSTTSIAKLSTGLLSASITAQQNPSLKKTTSSQSRIMADDKSRKQATLGYVRDGQQTIGCVDNIRWRMRPPTLTYIDSSFRLLS